MTEHQTMNTIIHAAFRRDLARFDSALATFPDTQDRADQLWTAWENYAHQLHQHHDDEETIFCPAMRSSVRTSRSSATSTASTNGWRRPSRPRTRR